MSPSRISGAGRCHCATAIRGQCWNRRERVALLAQNRELRPQDATLTGGRCLVGRAPVSNVMLGEQLAQKRDQTRWNARMAPVLAPRNCHVMQSTSDEAPGLLAYVAPSLEVHHSPDVFHGQHARRPAVSAPMATKERAAHQRTVIVRMCRGCTAVASQIDSKQHRLLPPIRR